MALIILSIGFIGLAGYLISWFVTPEKYTMAIYHYNPQFVPGNEIAERNIINGSLRAVLEMYQRHPDWKYNFEISGLGLQLLNDSYYDLFEVLNNSITSGQCEFMLSAYSATLSIAYPYYEMEKSLNLSMQIAKSLNVRVSSVLFLQENQWHPACPILSKFGYNITVMSGDILSFYDAPYHPLQSWTYQEESMDVVIYPYELMFGFPRIDQNLQYYFRWRQDGESVNADVGALASESFTINEEMQRVHEVRAQNLESIGYQFITISEWVEICKKKGGNFYQTLNKYIPESIWSIFQTHSIMFWMGYNNGDFGTEGSENDGFYLASNYQSRNLLLATETLFEHYKGSLTNESQIAFNLTEAWKHQLLAEVSDSTGWYPSPEEWEYSLYHSQEAKNLCSVIIEHIKSNLNETEFQIFTDNKTVLSNSTDFMIASETSISKAELPTGIELLVEGANSIEEYYNVTWGEFSYYKIKLNVSPGEEIKIEFEMDDPIDNISYSPTFLESCSQILDNNYPFKVYLPLTNGFLYVNGFGIIKNCSAHHTALVWDHNSLYFTEHDQKHHIFPEYIIFPAELSKVLNLANLINTNPIIIV